MRQLREVRGGKKGKFPSTRLEKLDGTVIPPGRSYSTLGWSQDREYNKQTLNDQDTIEMITQGRWRI